MGSIIYISLYSQCPRCCKNTKDVLLVKWVKEWRNRLLVMLVLKCDFAQHECSVCLCVILSAGEKQKLNQPTGRHHMYTPRNIRHYLRSPYALWIMPPTAGVTTFPPTSDTPSITSQELTLHSFQCPPSIGKLQALLMVNAVIMVALLHLSFNV